MSRWRARSSGATVAVAATFLLAACGGGGQEQSANEPSGNFTVDVPVASFPTSQRLAQHTHMVIVVRNDSTKELPNVAVTVLSPHNGGPSAQAFGDLLAPNQNLASRSRPVWIIDRPPGPCVYSCRSGGPGGAVTAYTNTWALGPLKPGQTAKFDWGVTAVKAGTYVIEYQIAAGLNGKARAVLASGRRPTGRFTVTVHQAPQQSYVNGKGQIVVVGSKTTAR